MKKPAPIPTGSDHTRHRPDNAKKTGHVEDARTYVRHEHTNHFTNRAPKNKQ